MSGTPEIDADLKALLVDALKRIEQLERRLDTTQRSPEAAMVDAIWRAATRGRKSDRPDIVAADVRVWANDDTRLDGAIAAVLGAAWNPRQLGKSLARLWGRDLDGLTIKRSSQDDRQGAVWTITPTMQV